MSKPSAFAKRCQSAMQISNRNVMRQAIQRDYDVWTIALNREFGFGRKRLLRAQKAANAVYDEYAKALETDFTYGDAVLERAVAQIMDKGKKEG